MAKLTSVSVNIRRWASSRDEVLETLIIECLPKHYGWEAAQKAYYYAQRILKNRWDKGEKVILANSPRYAYLYAKNIIKDRWPEAESFIASDIYSSYYYSKYVLKERFPEFEKNFQRNAKVLAGASRYYGWHLEPLINYARFFLKDRLPQKFERTICERGGSAAYYAVHVLKRRWKAAEKNIVHAHHSHIDSYIRSLKSVKDRREFRTLLLAQSLAVKNPYSWCSAKDWIERNEKSENPVLFS
jgi:hypothetical protein